MSNSIKLNTIEEALEEIRNGKVIIVVATVVFLLLTYFPPRLFIFEDFLGYELRDEYGILEDYSEHRVFTDTDDF